MEFEKIAIVGAGMMGTGIGQVVAEGGYKVCLTDMSDAALEKSKAKIDQQLKKAVNKGRLSEQEADQVLNKITFKKNLEEAVSDVDFVIEAVPEKLELKKEIFSKLDGFAGPGAIFASNTSELSIATLAESTSRKDQVIGTHWFFPPQLMRLVEVVETQDTSPMTLEATLSFCKRVGKETVVCRDSQGFITSRAISALIAECVRIREEGVASIEDIDKAMRLGFNHPIGPFQMMDMSGVDVVYHSLGELTKTYGDRFKPSSKMAGMVERGELGQKSGKGFYDHMGK